MQQKLYRGIYLCLGYPDLEQSLDVLRLLGSQDHVDFIELGLPFSDPVADGQVISAAAQSALQNAQKRGIGPVQMLDQALQALADSAKAAKTAKDIYLMTYGNIVYHLQQKYGTADFNQLPLHGLIIPDVPLREQNFFRSRGLQHPIIPFATPETTEQDLALLGQEPALSAPFVYFVAVRGITGSNADFHSAELRQQYARVLQADQSGAGKQSSSPQRPVVLGFGIRGKEQIQDLAEFANGFVIGTAAVQLQDDSTAYRDFLRSLV